MHPRACLILFFFFFNDTATTEIYTLSLHDALPIFSAGGGGAAAFAASGGAAGIFAASRLDRKSTRLNSSHGYISYAVFCLKKKKQTQAHQYTFITLRYDDGNLKRHAPSTLPSTAIH